MSLSYARDRKGVDGRRRDCRACRKRMDHMRKLKEAS